MGTWRIWVLPHDQLLILVASRRSPLSLRRFGRGSFVEKRRLWAARTASPRTNLFPLCFSPLYSWRNPQKSWKKSQY